MDIVFITGFWFAALVARTVITVCVVQCLFYYEFALVVDRNVFHVIRECVLELCILVEVCPLTAKHVHMYSFLPLVLSSCSGKLRVVFITSSRKGSV